jgi:hypothetical protein
LSDLPALPDFLGQRVLKETRVQQDPKGFKGQRVPQGLKDLLGLPVLPDPQDQLD